MSAIGMAYQDAPRDALLEYFDINRFINPVAVTLTMKQRVDGRKLDEIEASENLRHFANRLSCRLLGSAAKRHNRRLQMLAVLETSADGRLHYHLLIDRPERCDPATFGVLLRQQWARTQFGYHEVDIQHDTDEGWVRYLLKRRQKASLLQSIDWLNCAIASEGRKCRTSLGHRPASPRLT